MHTADSPRPFTFQRRGFHRPMTGAERIRAFRVRNPGYDRRYKAKVRADLLARREKVKVAEAAREAIEALHAKLFAPARVQLALPAPAVTIEIPAMNMIPSLPSRRETRDAVLVTLERAG